MTKPPADPRGLYIHVPFCSVKCFYCDFTAFSGKRASISRYLKALDREARLYAEIPIETLYVGGGTPSELSGPEFEELFRIISDSFGPPERFKEATVEVNPESADAAKLDVLRRAGVGRLSIGLQTMEPRLLKEIGRRHTVGEFLDAFRGARERGFSVNVDLMYGLPGQSLKEVLSSLRSVIGLGPDHISLYGLQVEDFTLFAKRGVKPDEDVSREMFGRSLDALQAGGFRHYEISNFAKPGHESVHNRIYWSGGEYVGLGCGASGHVRGQRYENKDRLEDYCAALERGESPVDSRESLDRRRKLGETILLGLRMLEGIELTPEIEGTFAEEWRSLQAQGLVEIAAGWVRLTREGIFLANRVFSEFVEPFRAPAPEENSAPSCAS